MFIESPDEGRALDFRLLLVRSTLAARRMTIDPVRTGRLHRRSTLRLVRPCGFAWRQRQDASNPLLQPTFCVTSTRASTISGDHLPLCRGETPPALGFGIRLERGVSTKRRVGRRTTLTVIQPPAVARLTARRPASGHAAIPVHDGEGACARTSSWLSRGIETAAALSAGGRFCRANPLTPLFHVWLARSRGCVVCHSPGAVQSGHVNAADFPELGGAFRRRSPLPETLASSFNGALPSLAGEGSRCTCSPVFSKARKLRRLRLDPLARRCRGRFVGRMRFYDFCK